MITRHTLALLLVGALLATRVDAQIAITTPPPTGLLGAYAMSSGVDASGNGRTATLTNTTTAPGKYAEGQRFNGASARMTIPSVNVSAGFTVEAWVLLTAASSRLVPALRSGSTGWQAIVYRGFDNVFLSEVGAGFFTAGFTTGTTIVQIVSPTATPPGAWHHVAAVYDGATLGLVVDGARVASMPATGAVVSSTQPWEVGGSAVDQGYLTGTIDDVRIYSRALTPAEIESDRATPVDSVREPVVGWDLEVWSKAAPPSSSPSTSPPPLAGMNFPRSGAACNLAPLPPPAGVVANPAKARVTDPDLPARECELVIQTFVLGLPVGLGYTVTARARGATTSSERSATSNAFDRVAETIPPLPVGSPIVR